jgi:hypothetical protein
VSLGDKALRVAITANRSAEQTADSVDQAVRHFGISKVALVADDRGTLYWAIFELLRRGYEPDEIQSMLGSEKWQVDAICEARHPKTTRTGRACRLSLSRPSVVSNPSQNFARPTPG